MIVGLSGLAGSGKDTVADILVRDHGFAKIAFADPMKRAVHDWFDWNAARLWGPSENRNAPDATYGGLTARKALQFLGTEIGRELYKDVWVEYGLRVAKRLMAYVCYRYSPERGVYEISDGTEANSPKGVAISDVRFVNEFQPIQKAGGKVIRIVRTGAGLNGAAGLHASEMEQFSIPDNSFDAVLVNDGTLEELAEKVAVLVTTFEAKIAKDDAEEADILPF